MNLTPKLLSALLITSYALVALVANASDPADNYTEYISALTSGIKGAPVRLVKDQTATTTASFKPPVDILIEAETDSTNLRISYAADQVIFNWEQQQSQLRVDGGPASGQHKRGAGAIPIWKYAKIHWVVTPTKQCIYVDDQLRFEHSEDYSHIDKPISVFGGAGSAVTVKSIKVKPLPASTR